jgi:hypothetical protein
VDLQYERRLFRGAYFVIELEGYLIAIAENGPDLSRFLLWRRKVSGGDLGALYHKYLYLYRLCFLPLKLLDLLQLLWFPPASMFSFVRMTERTTAALVLQSLSHGHNRSEMRFWSEDVHSCRWRQVFMKNACGPVRTTRVYIICAYEKRTRSLNRSFQSL